MSSTVEVKTATRCTHATARGPLRICVVSWSGAVGGAENHTLELTAALRGLGHDAALLFIGSPGSMAARADSLKVPYESMYLTRGGRVLTRPRRFAEAVRASGPDGVLLPYAGYLATLLRVCRYDGTIVAVEHGSLLNTRTLRPVKRMVRATDRRLGERACDIEVGVSDAVLEALARRTSRTRKVRIYNGVDLSALRSHGAPRSSSLRIGCVSRLAPGKGIEDALTCLAMLPAHLPVRLLIAGDGPERLPLEAHASRLRVAARVDFLGWVRDIRNFWSQCDLALIPSRQVESFGLAAVEAMACGKPVVTYATGALEEVVADGVTGTIAPLGDLEALSDAVRGYVGDSVKLQMQGRNARRRCEGFFDIRDAAQAYARLFA